MHLTASGAKGPGFESQIAYHNFSMKLQEFQQIPPFPTNRERGDFCHVLPFFLVFFWYYVGYSLPSLINSAFAISRIFV